MTTVTASQFDPLTDLAFYNAASKTGPFHQNAPTVESAGLIVFSFTDGANNYILDFHSAGDFKYLGTTPYSGTLTEIREAKIPGGDANRLFQAFDIGNLTSTDSSGNTVSGIPVSTLDAWLLGGKQTTIFNGLFSGDDHFTVQAPGPNVIDGGPGTDTVTFVSNFADNSIVINQDGSETVTGPAGSTVLRNVEIIQFNDGAIGTAALGEITADYQLLAGRAPTLGELSFWSNTLANGTTDAQLQQALLGDTSNPRPTALVDTLYEANYGRAATSDELSFWQSYLQNGYGTYAQVQGFLQNASDGAAHAADLVNTYYELFLGAPATTAQHNFWDGRLQGGQGTIGDLEQALASDPSSFGGLAVSVGVTAAYENILGREPSNDESTFWNAAISGGYAIGTIGFLREFLQASPDGQAHLAADVQGLYESFFGRGPSSGELNYWTDQLQNQGLSVDQMRHDLSTYVVPGEVAANVIAVYDAFTGAPPSDFALADAVNRITSGVVELAQVQHNLDAVSGFAFGKVLELNVEFTGQAPDAASQSSEIAGIDSGQLSLQHLAQELLQSSAGQAHIGQQVSQLYATYTGTGADSSTQQFWAGEINSGAWSYASIADLLATITTSGPTYHIDLLTDSTDNSVSFNGIGFGHAVLTSFDPATSHIDFGAAAFSGFLPLAHAEQTTDYNGVSDVLISFDATDTILLKGVTLAQLHTSDFVFG